MLDLVGNPEAPFSRDAANYSIENIVRLTLKIVWCAVYQPTHQIFFLANFEEKNVLLNRSALAVIC